MGKLPAKKQKTRKRGGKRSTSWKPGQSGNPKGRPSLGLSWKELIVKIGDELFPGTDNLTLKEAVVRAAYHFAMKGNALILRELMQRSEPVAGELNVHHDWREVAKAQGLNEADVLAEAESILNESRHQSSDPAAS